MVVMKTEVGLSLFAGHSLVSGVLPKGGTPQIDQARGGNPTGPFGKPIVTVLGVGRPSGRSATLGFHESGLLSSHRPNPIGPIE